MKDGEEKPLKQVPDQKQASGNNGGAGGNGRQAKNKTKSRPRQPRKPRPNQGMFFIQRNIFSLQYLCLSNFQKSKKIKRIIQLVRFNLMLHHRCHIQDHIIIKIPFQSIHQFRKTISFWTMTGSRLPSLSRLNIISLMPIYKKVSKIRKTLFLPRFLDFWLRGKMDSEGCLPMRTISSFKRVKELTMNHEQDRMDFILAAIANSKTIEGT